MTIENNRGKGKSGNLAEPCPYNGYTPKKGHIPLLDLVEGWGEKGQPGREGERLVYYPE